jgi:hypothetical protein
MFHLKQLFIRRDEPAIHTVIDPVTKIVTSEEWYNNDGRLNRTDGPASISRDAATGNIIREGWYRNGKRFLASVEVRAAWLKNSGEQIDPSAERRATWLQKIGEKPATSSPQL